ncbi:hypothetical protein PROPEN_03836 [Proteus penneri ATCC 35198]|nr:hypothetical protein PROPEN_03836 [Proteus penneri ATCC 35198]
MQKYQHIYSHGKMAVKLAITWIKELKKKNQTLLVLMQGSDCNSIKK